MIKDIRQRTRFQQGVSAACLLLIGLVLYRPEAALAQNPVTTTGGTIGKVPKWTGTASLGDSVIFESGGNIGIGTAAPILKLHVSEDGDFYTGIRAQNMFNGLNSQAGFAVQSNAAAFDFKAHAGARTISRWGVTLGGWAEFLQTGGNRLAIGSLGASPLILGTNSLNRVHITPSGEVGIGTAAPTEKLQVIQDGDFPTFLRVQNLFNGPNAQAAAAVQSDAAIVDFKAHASARTISRWGVTLGGWAEFLQSGGNGFAIGSLGPRPLILGTNGLNRIHVTPTGEVGIGTASPSQKLHIRQDVDANVFTLIENASNTANAAAVFRAQSNTAMVNFQAHADARIISRFGVSLGGWAEFLQVTGNGLIIGTNNARPLILGTGAVDRLHITPTGDVGIGTASPAAKLHVVGTATVSGTIASGSINVTGDITATGNIAAKYQDVAEWVPARHPMPAGTVVVLDPDHSNQVLPCSQAYDTRVAGVISANPGLILGERGEGKLMVATTGRVRVKVDATRAPIRVGDLLVTSDKEGIAMKSQPIDIAGTQIHRPGTLIGKALEPLENGIGEILVLLSMQ
ncbi:MAG TPA: hypothetical protein VJH03_22815 [Blastocatellia bacterium]|nr:hypothetical protein [Blastocatellia bacterium]